MIARHQRGRFRDRRCQGGQQTAVTFQQGGKTVKTIGVGAMLRRHPRALSLNKAFAGELVPQDPTDEPTTAQQVRIKSGRPKALVA